MKLAKRKQRQSKKATEHYSPDWLYTPDGKLVYEDVAAYRQAARDVGVPEDSIQRYIDAEVCLQPKQLLFAAAARRADISGEPDEIGYGGAKGGGKSFVEFAVAAIDDCQLYPGLKVLYLRLTAKYAHEQIDDLTRTILRRVPHKKKHGVIEFPNGSKIIVGGFNNDKQALSYQGIEYDLLLLEEATQVRLHTYTTLSLSIRTSKRGWRPRKYSSANPLGIGHKWYYDKFINPKKREPNTVFISATIDDNAFVNVEYKAVLDTLTGAELKAYRFGEWEGLLAGAYFSTFDQKLHVIKPFIELPRGWRYWLSYDYGFNHPSVVLLHVEDGDGNKYTIREIIHTQTQVEDVIADTTTTLADFGLSPDAIDHVIAGTDIFSRTGNAEYTIADKWASAGYHVLRAEIERIPGWHYLAKLLGNPDRNIAPTWYITQECERLIETLMYLERNPNRPEDVLKIDAEDGEGGDDPADAARYGLYTPHLSSIA